MTAKSDWQGRVGEAWAKEWHRTDRSFTELTERLRTRILAHDFRVCCDIGCGAGELALSLARQRSDAQVTGFDVSPALLAVARTRIGGLKNLHFELADVSSIASYTDPPPDMFVSRHGVMFFDDPVGAFTHVNQLGCGQGARLIFSCFRKVDDNPIFGEVGRLVPSDGAAADPYAPGPFAFSDRDHVHTVLSEAGWSDIEFERVDFSMIAGAGEDPIADALGYFSHIGPAARALAECDAGTRENALEAIENLARNYLSAGKVALPSSCWIVSASS